MGDDGQKFLPRDEVEHVFEVDEDGYSRWELSARLGLLYVSLYLEGRGFDGEVHSSCDAHSKVEGEEVVGESASVMFG